MVNGLVLDGLVLDEAVILGTEGNGVATDEATDEEFLAVRVAAEEGAGVELGPTGIDGITPVGTEFKRLVLINNVMDALLPWPLPLHWPTPLHWPMPLPFCLF